MLLFDGVCNLCNGSVRFVLKRDKRERFLFAALQSEAGHEMLARCGRSAEALDSIVLVEGDRVFIKSEAALRIAQELGAPWSWFRVFRLLPRGWRDACYDFVARHRYRWFGRRQSCMVPTPGQAARFLDPLSPAPPEQTEEGGR